jgi:hypothetical protein
MLATISDDTSVKKLVMPRHRPAHALRGEHAREKPWTRGIDGSLAHRRGLAKRGAREQTGPID